MEGRRYELNPPWNGIMTPYRNKRRHLCILVTLPPPRRRRVVCLVSAPFPGDSPLLLDNSGARRGKTRLKVIETETSPSPTFVNGVEAFKPGNLVRNENRISMVLQRHDGRGDRDSELNSLLSGIHPEQPSIRFCNHRVLKVSHAHTVTERSDMTR
jgi:hypothetical protein